MVLFFVHCPDDAGKKLKSKHCGKMKRIGNLSPIHPHKTEMALEEEEEEGRGGAEEEEETLTVMLAPE
jgi:hypothetical protein